MILLVTAAPLGAEPAVQAPEIAPIRANAEKGDAIAQYQLGLRYTTGRGVAKDYAQAAAWYRKAAEQGHAAQAAGRVTFLPYNCVATV